VSNKNQYMEPILVLLKEKLDLARNEFKKTDLNGPGEYSKMEKWFSELEKIIVRTPPVYYVESIILYEDVCGKIVRVEYKYCDKEIKDHIPSLRIVAGLV